MTNKSRNKQTYQKTKNYHELPRDHLKWVLDPSQKIPHPRLHKHTVYKVNFKVSKESDKNFDDCDLKLVTGDAN